MISDVEHCLAQRVPNCLAGHHQVEDAQDREHCSDESQGVRIAPREFCEQAESAGSEADRNEIETEGDRQAPPATSGICGCGRLCGRHPARGDDPDKHHNNDYCRSQTIGFEAAEQSLHGGAYEKSEPHKGHDPKRARRQHSSHEPGEVQAYRAGDQRRVDAEPGQESGSGNLEW